MTRFVLVSDTTLSYEYRNFPLLDFLPSAPSRAIPPAIYKFLKGPPPEVKPNGELLRAPYSVRKLQASLLRKFDRKDIAVAHDDYLANFIDDKTEVIGISTMDPLGVGPTTMSYYALRGGNMMAWVRKDWDSLLEKVNRARRGKKAKLIVGGPGAWEFTILRDEIEKYNFDYIFQGETDDIAPALFEQVATDSIDSTMFYRGYMSYDDNFRKVIKKDDKFLARGMSLTPYPKLDQIPLISEPSVKGMVEVMRGCGIGCDFCEVTLRPLRYYEPEEVVKEVTINARSGQINGWLHSDEIFAYKHGNMYEPNEEALTDLFSSVMAVDGIERANPTHGRISIPAGYPEMLGRLSKILKAGPRNWIGVQTGVETGSDSLAKKHMPNKTLPLKIGPDGSWADIVWQGVYNETKYYWRPAFTIQVGQAGETEEDYWDTIGMINRLSYSYSENRPFEFTITPLVNVPLGRIKSRSLNKSMLTKSQLAVYYASYRHLAKMAVRDGYGNTEGNFFARAGTGSIISFGGLMMLKYIERLARKAGVDLDKVKNYSVPRGKEIHSLNQAIRA
ncbi:MAG: B12-binding domain-containing radical SAM protein [Candidatus Thermoplasmatota archaeon]|jgi:radical SAM superfamily enzyme YgiQ (UPF0313 family)|nr:B12-binding domain-containing radical SAM protein [Candidatus Thermoplasmatota archaeon]